VADDARRALLTGLIDHAPLFPPASLPMEEALEENRRFRASPDGWLVRRFVVPASKFEELGGENVPLAVVVDDADARGWVDDRRVSAIETKPGIRSADLDGRAQEVYVEVPTDDELLAEKLAELSASGLRAKVRCGGARVPSVAELAVFIRRCRELRLPFKVTAGLHHPVRGVAEHGFLNVVAAALFGQEEEALAHEDPASFGLTADGFSWRDSSASPVGVTRLRAEVFAGIGSCSAQEPADELRALGFLP
jgi:hypothetical protein